MEQRNRNGHRRILRRMRHTEFQRLPGQRNRKIHGTVDFP